MKALKWLSVARNAQREAGSYVEGSGTTRPPQPYESATLQKFKKERVNDLSKGPGVHKSPKINSWIAAKIRRLGEDDPTLTYFSYCSGLNETDMNALASALEMSTHIKSISLICGCLHSSNSCASAASRTSFVRRILSIHPSLEYVNLSGNGLTEENAIVIAEALRTNTNLKVLELGGNNIGDIGSKALADALIQNNTLETLIIYGNEIGLIGCRAIASALKANRVLKVLDLDQNKIGAKSARAIAGALHQNTTLEKLTMNCNRIMPSGCNALSEALAMNKYLKVLKLGKNECGDSGAACLARALEQNTSLNELVLSNNSIGNSGCAAIARSLKSNSTLCILDLRYNEAITKASATKLAAAIAHNCSVEKLLLSSIRNDSIPKRVAGDGQSTKRLSIRGQIRQRCEQNRLSKGGSFNDTSEAMTTATATSVSVDNP